MQTAKEKPNLFSRLFPQDHGPKRRRQAGGPAETNTFFTQSQRHLFFPNRATEPSTPTELWCGALVASSVKRSRRTLSQTNANVRTSLNGNDDDAKRW